MKSRIAFSIMLLISVAGCTQDKPAASPAPQASGALTFGDAHIVIPPGWTHIERQSLLLMLPPDLTEQRNLTILLLPGRDLTGVTFPQAVDAILKKSLAANEHLVQYSELPLRKGPGYDFLTRSMIVSDDAGHNSIRMGFAANPGHRLEMLIVSADSKETLQHYQSEISSVLNSYSFADVAANTKTKREESGTASSVPSQQPGTEANPKGNSKIGSSRTTSAGNRTQVSDGESVLLCIDPARLDFAMDAAKRGDNYAASRALSYDYFFRVTGPAWLEITQYEMNSKWPKALVNVLDGDSAGRTGWVLLSELKRAAQPQK